MAQLSKIVEIKLTKFSVKLSVENQFTNSVNETKIVRPKLFQLIFNFITLITRTTVARVVNFPEV